MTEQKHAKEPWMVDLDEDGSVYGILSGDERIVETDSGFYPPNKADATRIVSCVNALAGIPDPAEFVAAARELLKFAKWIRERETPYTLDEVMHRARLVISHASLAFGSTGGGE